MDMFATTPIRIKSVDGGIRVEVAPAEASRAAANCGGYPCRRRPGSVTFPIAAVSADDEPEMPWKNSEATTMAEPRPPRPRPTVMFATSISRAAMPPSDMIAPAKINRGIVRNGNELS